MRPGERVRAAPMPTGPSARAAPATARGPRYFTHCSAQTTLTATIVQGENLEFKDINSLLMQKEDRSTQTDITLKAFDKVLIAHANMKGALTAVGSMLGHAQQALAAAWRATP